MKRLSLILGFLLMVTVATAQNGGGLFQRGEDPKQETNRGGIPGLPGHGEDGNQPAPVGAGVGLLIGFGAAYAMYKKKSEND